MSARVSVLTPVYNGAEYLAACIESVLAQGFGDYDYTIVDNCSTDGSLEIARSYARRDRRIQVKDNRTFVGAVENHNRAFGFVEAHHKYCKVVSADDWIMPDCLGRMVALGEAHPSVGIIGCYQQSRDSIKWQGLPRTVDVMSGRDAGRLVLLRGVHVFGTPTSALYRADLLRSPEPFFPHTGSHADTSACFEALQHCDFGFVHEVLSVERVHTGQWTAEMDALNAGSVFWLELVLRYGPLYLTAPEFEAQKEDAFDRYYRGLGGCVLKLKGPKFWKFHRERFRELGIPWKWDRIAMAVMNEIITEAKDPAAAIRKVRAAIREQ